MKFDWDERKRKANLRRHGIDFVDCESVFAGPTATIPDDRFEYGERRFVTFGLVADRVVSVVHTETADAIRVISIRKATKREEALYLQSIAD